MCPFSREKQVPIEITFWGLRIPNNNNIKLDNPIPPLHIQVHSQVPVRRFYVLVRPRKMLLIELSSLFVCRRAAVHAA